jgi:hypothetical protein
VVEEKSGECNPARGLVNCGLVKKKRKDKRTFVLLHSLHYFNLTNEAISIRILSTEFS